MSHVLSLFGQASLQYNGLYTDFSAALEGLSYPLSTAENLYANAVALQARL